MSKRQTSIKRMTRSQVMAADSHPEQSCASSFILLLHVSLFGVKAMDALSKFMIFLPKSEVIIAKPYLHFISCTRFTAMRPHSSSSTA